MNLLWGVFERKEANFTEMEGYRSRKTPMSKGKYFLKGLL